jgi:cation transport ATPase
MYCLSLVQYLTILPGSFPFENVYFKTAAMIIALILVRRLLESGTEERASSAVRNFGPSNE